ncbi:uncharacterized protein PRCAT00001215001 [Priceomyces carsonii]|uniref:uncharacterized protein n=1 Tax=Priceomyces carsonii TaxID=28549 RepID=UPI002EDB1707|nr:unnamed protein product [Priceomyces carsonii]
MSNNEDKEKSESDSRQLPSIRMFMKGSSNPSGRGSSGDESVRARQLSISSQFKLPSVGHSPQSSIGSGSGIQSSIGSMSDLQSGIHLSKAPPRRLLDKPAEKEEVYPFNFQFPPPSGIEKYSPVQRSPYKQESFKSFPLSFSSTLQSSSSRSSSLQGRENDFMASIPYYMTLCHNTYEFFEVLNHRYRCLLESKIPTPLWENILEGYLDTPFGRKYVGRDTFEKFILSFAPEVIDSVRDNLTKEVDFLDQFLKFIQASKSTVSLTDQSPSQRIEVPDYRAPEFPFRQHQVEPISPISASPNTPRHLKRRSSSKSLRGPRPGGEIVALKVSLPRLETSSQEAATKPHGYLNKDLSMRSEMSCKHCGSRDTPEWRRGPGGNRTLCNACGLFYSKLVKRFGSTEALNIMRQRKEESRTTDRQIT